ALAARAGSAAGLADHRAVDPAGAGAGALATRPLTGLAPAAVLTGTGTAPVTTTVAAAALARTATAPSAAAAVTTAAGGLPAVGAVRTAQVLDLLGVQALAGAPVLRERALGVAGDVEVGVEVLRGR